MLPGHLVHLLKSSYPQDTDLSSACVENQCTRYCVRLLTSYPAHVENSFIQEKAAAPHDRCGVVMDILLTTSLCISYPCFSLPQLDLLGQSCGLTCAEGGAEFF